MVGKGVEAYHPANPSSFVECQHRKICTAITTFHKVPSRML